MARKKNIRVVDDALAEEVKTVNASAAEFTWEDPPARKRGPAESTTALKAALEANVDCWAKVRTFDEAKKAASYSGGLRKTLGEGYEVVQRGHDVFARYVTPE